MAVQEVAKLLEVAKHLAAWWFGGILALLKTNLWQLPVGLSPSMVVRITFTDIVAMIATIGRHIEGSAV